MVKASISVLSVISFFTLFLKVVILDIIHYPPISLSHLLLILNRWIHLSTSFYFTERRGYYSLKFLQPTIILSIYNCSHLWSLPYYNETSFTLTVASTSTSSSNSIFSWFILDLSYWFFSLSSFQISFPIDSTVYNILQRRQEERKLPPTTDPLSTFPYRFLFSQSQISLRVWSSIIQFPLTPNSTAILPLPLHWNSSCWGHGEFLAATSIWNFRKYKSFPPTSFSFSIISTLYCYLYFMNRKLICWKLIWSRS